VQDLQQFVAIVGRYTSPKYLKRGALVLLGLALLATLVDRAVFPLWPVAAKERAGIAQAVAKAWPAGSAWLAAHRDPLEFAAVLAAALTAAGYFGFKAYARRQQAAQNGRLAADAEVLLVRTDPDDDSPIERAANLFLSLRQVLASGPAWRGKAVHISLEIVVMGDTGKIGFLVWTPKELKESIMVQVQAHYPLATMEVVKDPLQGLDGQPLAAVELGLAADSLYPIRTDFGKGGEPLAAFISALTPGSSTVAAGVQFICRPAAAGWQQQGAETVTKLREQMAATEAKMVGRAEKDRLEAIEAKKDQLGYEVTARVFGVGADRGRVQQLVQAFGQFAGLNSFAVTRRDLDWATVRGRAYPLDGRRAVLNVEEFAAAWHPPGKRTPSNDVAWTRAKVLNPPRQTIVTEEEYRAGKCRIVGHFKYPDGRTVNLGWRRTADSAPASYDALTHGYILGPTGSGKSTLLLNLIMDDVEHNCGVIVMEPHDDLTTAIMERVPRRRWGDVIKLDAADMARPFGFNFMECPDPADRAILTSMLMGVFKKISDTPWGVQMEQVMKKTLLALLETHTNATMYTIYNFMSDVGFREQVLVGVRDPLTRRFWEQFNARKDAEQIKMVEAPLRRLEDFLGNPLVRNIVSQPVSTVRFRELMDSRKIILINLSTGTLGEENAALMGALFVSAVWRAAASRRHMPEAQRTPTYFWIDEFQK
jgi:hypothetical protein